MISSASLRRGAFTFVIDTTNAAWGQKHFLVQGCSGLLWAALGCLGLLQVSLGCFGLLWGVLGHPWKHESD